MEFKHKPYPSLEHWAKATRGRKFEVPQMSTQEAALMSAPYMPIPTYGGCSGHRETINKLMDMVIELQARCKRLEDRVDGEGA